MRNFLLKFEHTNGSNVWFTIHTNACYVLEIARKIEKRTSFKYLNDCTELG